LNAQYRATQEHSPHFLRIPVTSNPSAIRFAIIPQRLLYVWNGPIAGAITEILRVAIDQIYGRIAIENFDSFIRQRTVTLWISRYGTIQP
jgi:hypothetical protein